MTRRPARTEGIVAGAADSLRRLGFGLSRELWIVQVGIFLNYLGWGAVLPFEIIYLHDGRGFSLEVAGLVVGTVTGLAVVAAPVAGNGALLPSQSTLLASLASPQVRHRASAVSRVAGNLGMGLGGALGGLVAAYGLGGLVVLFLANALSYVLYVVILVVVVPTDARPTPVPGGYRVLVRDRPFLRLALTNVAVIAVGWGVFTWVVPPYARSELGVGPRLIGLLLFANALTVTLAQLPVARLAEGRRRTVAMATASLTFVGACLLVVGADLAGWDHAFAVLLAAAVAVGVGECFHTTALMPLVADLAPAALRGRYMAAMGLSWSLGLALAPTLGMRLLSVSPPAALLAAAGVALAAALSALALERELPPAARLTPRPGSPVPARAVPAEVVLPPRRPAAPAEEGR